MPKVLVQFDAANQESRLIAEFSQDSVMLDTFRKEKDIHSTTGAYLGGMSYETFMQQYKAENPVVTGEFGLRYQGKFTNLSCQYRIGVKALRVKARVDYGMNVGQQKAQEWLETYKTLYKGIPEYWKNAIYVARQKGYAETLAGRRFKLEFWDEDNKWGTESSAINHPIQGSGADMKQLARAMMARHFPAFRWLFDLHDGLFYTTELTETLEADILRARNMLNNLPYEAAWGYKPSIPLPWDAEYGTSWGSLKKVK